MASKQKQKDPIETITTMLSAANEDAPDIRDTRSMRQFLMKGMHNVMSGQISTFQAKAVCNFAQQIYNTSSLEIRTALAKQRLGENNEIKPVSLD